ncbi:hypothetical protein V8G54_020985 [Vigna mungo]|uniref:Uncharacterized protein n=1 Tax=Vigna mungo TaxID=3915 RepID=A0AAQ3RWZ2_VIGMU
MGLRVRVAGQDLHHRHRLDRRLRRCPVKAHRGDVQLIQQVIEARRAHEEVGDACGQRAQTAGARTRNDVVVVKLEVPRGDIIFGFVGACVFVSVPAAQHDHGIEGRAGACGSTRVGRRVYLFEKTGVTIGAENGRISLRFSGEGNPNDAVASIAPERRRRSQRSHDF